MSSKSYDNATAEKLSDTPSPYPDGLETTSINYCPHCGGELDRSLAQHMAHGRCEEHTPDSEEATPTPDPEIVTPPLLEEHDEREHADVDFEERRQLADELAEAGVWA